MLHLFLDEVCDTLKHKSIQSCALKKIYLSNHPYVTITCVLQFHFLALETQTLGGISVGIYRSGSSDSIDLAGKDLAVSIIFVMMLNICARKTSCG